MKKASFTILLLIVTRLLPAQTSLIAFGSEWKYLDDGTNQETTWRATNFNDAGWKVGLGQLGYGDGDEATIVSFGGNGAKKYITTYFRKNISITNPASFSSIAAKVKRDDGVIVFVNGEEVFRSNLPSGTVTNTTLASCASSGNTPQNFTIKPSVFVSGNNVIAVEIHQCSASSSDISFDLELMLPPPTTINLVSYNSQWKYLDNGTNQGTAWRATNFNDTGWKNGLAQLGYGDGDEATIVSYGSNSTNKYITTYFRKKISISNLASLSSFTANIKRDDGVIVYVNGAAIYRNNLPSGIIRNTTRASTAAADDGNTAQKFMINSSVFINGDNVIAAEIHQNSPSSSDISFDLELKAVQGATTVTLTRGPYLQMVSQNTATLRWRTNIPTDSKISVGTIHNNYTLSATNSLSATEHEIQIRGLNSDSKYFYKFGSSTKTLQAGTDNYFITTPPANTTKKIRVAAFGDCGRNNNGVQTATLTAYRNYAGTNTAELLLLLGDNAYESGFDYEYQTNFFDPYNSTILKNHALFTTPGNHDYYSATQTSRSHDYYKNFTMPKAAEIGGVASGTEAYYSFDWGNIHFLSLDSYGQEGSGTTRLYDTLGAQVTWIKADLAANTKKWTIAYWHHPPFSMGNHNSDRESELINIRNNFIRILERYGVDLILCGHSHDYERSYLLKGYYGNEASFDTSVHTASTSTGKYDSTENSCPYTTLSGTENHGTVYVVSGSAGANGPVQASFPHNALPFSFNDGGMFYFEVEKNRLDAKFIRQDGNIADQFSIMKDVNKNSTISIAPGSSTVLTASWVGTYRWSTGATTQSITVSPSSTTIYKVTDNKSCLSDIYNVVVPITQAKRKQVKILNEQHH